MGQHNAKGMFTTRFPTAAALGMVMTTSAPAVADTKSECRGLPEPCGAESRAHDGTESCE